MPLRLLDLFSGIGGFSYAAERLVGGFETVQFVERERFCQRILHKHWPSVPIHDDICTFNPEPHSADVVCGGFPCQDISVAGKRAGIAEGTRSGLFYELMRVVCLVRPRYIVLENVAAIVSNGLDTVLGELAAAGYDAEWACIRASDVGACHRRDRWWCVAYANDYGRGGQGLPVREEACRWEPAGIPEPAGSSGGSVGADLTGRQTLPADSSRLHCQRRGTTGNMAGTTGAGQADGEQRQRDGDAADDCGAVVADTQGRGRRTGQGPGAGAAGYEGQGAGYCGEGSAVVDPHHTGSVADANGIRVERPNELESKWAQWPATAVRLDPDWRAYVSEPVLRRGDDGLSGRVDRLKALGNSVVPQVAAIPLMRVLALDSGSWTSQHRH